MDNENKWEYDYSNLYRQPAQQQPGGYVNVGSSGTNAANQYSTAGPTPATPGQAPGSVNFTGAAQPGYGGVGYGGAVPPQYGQGAAATPPTPPQKPRRAKSSHGAGARVLTLFLALVFGFGGGAAGSYLMNRFLGGDGTKVVVQSVERDTSAATATTTSADGSALSLSEVSALVTPSVVVITTEEMVSVGGWYGQNYVESGAGSGVIMSEDGYIMTCAHVISGASHITVTVGEKDYDAQVVGGDSESDIAVIKIDASGLTPAVMGNSDGLAVGEQVLAVGNPLGQLGGSVTEGIVSALNRDVVVEDQEMSLIQTSASVSPGNSGGGLFNMAGELIGIVNAKSSDTSAEGLGFAIPINAAFQVAQSLIENGYVSGRPAMGITVVTVDNETTMAQYGVNAYGVYVYAVEENSPAAAAGLKPGDRIISINDTEVAQSQDLTGYIANCEVGDTVSLSIARGGQISALSLTLGEKSSTGLAQSTTPSTSGQGRGVLPQGDQ